MKIMVGYHPKEGNKNLLEIAVKHAKAFNGTVLLVTSMRGGEEVELKEFTRVEEQLEKAKVFFEKQEIKIETKLLVRGLSPGEDLVNFSKEVKADEIIIGAKSRSKVGKLIFGSTVQFVILEAGCPVLSVK
jgi:nucleotide-binding universal stress UspA family protein